jgi:hypothetical protein
MNEMKAPVNTETIETELMPAVLAATASARVIFTEGGKGGVGKTAFMGMLVEWYAKQDLNYTLLDLDTENKARGSLKQYFPQARKIDVHQPDSLDVFVEILDEASLVIADMGAGAGSVAAEWFDRVYEGVKELGVAFTAIGLVTGDQSSVDSVCAWGGALQNRVDYLVVKNRMTKETTFGYWDECREAKAFRETFHPKEIEIEYRTPKVEERAREYGATIQAIASGRGELPSELKSAMVRIHAQQYRRNAFAELDRVAEILL